MPISTKAIGLLLLLAPVIAARRATAQTIRPQFGVGAGITVPTGDYHADPGGVGFKPGWQGMALVAFVQPNSPVVLRVDGIYGRSSSNDKLAQLGYPDQHTRLLGLNVDVTYEFQLSPSVMPYMLVGGGLHTFKLSMPTRDTVFTLSGWNAGGGVRYGIGRRTLFLEARYCRLARVLDQHRVYQGTFYHYPGVQVQQIGVTAGIRFGGT
jgi:hypothetical protein